jgi:hypothetical protein
MNAFSTLMFAFALVSRNGISCSLAIYKKMFILNFSGKENQLDTMKQI